ncbi:DUF4138 domain-containing protein (plasmid) [Myroides albus]|uniref:Conjugal transfer protein TraN n=1 Tax=Myroides odoratimimus TaxID=76832 RepID=A0AAI8G6W2_9FLAO|nr:MULTISPECIES: DUF4138 domain-containing protein [Myroides]ALU28435.1 hypothetical protein AS202_19840 [Myroides odoratimimus]ALU28505.1 hypothetical protein AS202_20210 [Myroides odoratimimus]UVD81354.1 DUF4138 domain-containing protein [Myroides albus]
MKTINLFLLIFFLFTGSIFAQPRIIEASVDKFVAIQFPTKIDMFQNSVSVDEVLGIKSMDDILFLQFVDDENIPETNLFVKTIDNKTYQFLLRYNPDPKNLHIIIGNESTNTELGITNSSPLVADYSTIASKVAKEKGYIRSRNYTTYKNINVFLKGIYIYQNRVYFFMQVENKTNLNYDINAFKFFVTNKSGIANSEQTLDVAILETFPNITQLKRGTYDFVFSMAKFTVGADKKLLFEMTESNGDRNISMEINAQLLDKARPINSK